MMQEASCYQLSTPGYSIENGVAENFDYRPTKVTRNLLGNPIITDKIKPVFAPFSVNCACLLINILYINRIENSPYTAIRNEAFDIGKCEVLEQLMMHKPSQREAKFGPQGHLGCYLGLDTDCHRCIILDMKISKVIQITNVIKVRTKKTSD